jgi:thymidylate synthase (FAD)
MTQNTIKVLDHGFVTLRNLAGPTRRIVGPNPEEPRNFDADDTDVANAARMSFDSMDMDRTYEIEMRLNHYLMRNRHMTPFEIIEVWLEMKLPIFVARQLVRQRTQTINEVSGRYVTLPEEWYIPEKVGGKAKDKKQGQTDNLDKIEQGLFRRSLQEHCKSGYANYLASMNSGVAPEHARMFLSLNHYTHWMTKMNLRNLMVSFLSLRDHGHAQIESQQYARATISLIEPHLPGLMKLYNELVKVLE